MVAKDQIESTLTEIAEKAGVGIDVIKKEFADYYKSDFIQKSKQFKSNDMRFEACIGWLYTQYLSRAPTTEHKIIPIGVEKIYKTKNKEDMSAIYCLEKRRGVYVIKRIALFREHVQLSKVVTFDNHYTVRLVNLGDSGDYRADDRSKFTNPKALDDFDLLQILTKDMGRYIISPEDAPHNLSHIRTDGYTQSTDWKIVKGFVSSSSQKKLQLISPLDAIKQAGENVRPWDIGISGWASPEITSKFVVRSQGYFFGPITKSNMSGSTQYSMNIYRAIPIIIPQGQSDENTGGLQLEVDE